MTNTLRYSFPRYLASKKSVDDRALNRHVWQTLSAELALRPANTPLRVLEIGAGIGTMVERTLEWGLLKQANYTALDAQHENITQAINRLSHWASQAGYQVKQSSSGLRIQRLEQDITVHFEAIDLFDFIAREDFQTNWEVVIAHAFLDLLDLPSALPQILRLCTPGGLFYFSLNFDGLTVLEPVIDPVFDAQVLALYHRSMDERRIAGKPSGDSRAGRRLFDQITVSGGDILDAGSSDWVVFPMQGAYLAEEAYFLHFIIHTIHQELVHHPELDADRLADWATARHAQIDRGELVYIAHQLDFVGRARGYVHPE